MRTIRIGANKSKFTAMKSISCVTLVITYFLIFRINCDSNTKSNSNYSNKIEDFRKIIVRNLTEIPFQRRIDFENLINEESRGKNCLEDVEKCFKEDPKYEDAVNELSPILATSMPLVFDLSQIRSVSQTCKQQSQIYMKDLKNFEFWALQMYDASAKLPSGILSGNINQLGDFDLCLNSRNLKLNIGGQYCLASFQIQVPESTYFAGLHTLAQSHFHFRSQLTDPGHRVPRYSSINWALCVPDGCTSKDVEFGLKEKLNGTNFKIQVRVDDSMCQISKKSQIPPSTIVATGIFAGFILLVIGAAIYDYANFGEKNPWILAFSLRKNLNSFLSIKRSSNDIEAIHGIRFINAILLILSHKSMAAFFIPYTNRTEMVENLGKPWSVIARAASLYTDPFIMISGTLTAYSLLGKLKKNNQINFKEEYISRLLRILPPFAAVIAFCTFILPWIDSGPMWNLVITQHSHICKRNWWRNFLFIHNYFGFKDMCLTHTHHVGIDTQLFFISPFLVLMLWKWPKKGAITLMLMAAISTVMRYYVTYSMKLSNYVHFGTSIKQLFDTADNMYTLPAHRLTVYIMGIFLGYNLRIHREVMISKKYLQMGNMLALVSFCTAFVGPAFMGSIDYVYNPTDAAWYAAFAPILWCLSFAWIIFTTFTGSNVQLAKLLSLPLFSAWTKISYSVYLTQFPIFFYNVGITRTSNHYGLIKSMLNCIELFNIVLLSAMLTVIVEMPFQNIRNLIYANKTSQNHGQMTRKKIT